MSLLHFYNLVELSQNFSKIEHIYFLILFQIRIEFTGYTQLVKNIADRFIMIKFNSSCFHRLKSLTITISVLTPED